MKSNETLTHYNMKNLENTVTNDTRTDSVLFYICERVKNGKSGKQKPNFSGSAGNVVAVVAVTVTNVTVSPPARRSRWLSGTAPAVRHRLPPSADTC